MKKILLAAFIFSLAINVNTSVYAQVQFGPNKAISATGTLSAAAQTVTLSLNAESSGSVEITGTWVGTITFEASLGGTVWNPVNAVASSTSAPQSTTTVNGLYRLTPGSLTSFRVNMTSFTSGTATILIKASTGTGGIFANQIIPVTDTRNPNAIQPMVIAQPATQSLTATGQIQWQVVGGGFYNLTLTNPPGATATFVASTTFQTSADGATWTNVNANPIIGLPGSLAATATTTTVGLWQIFASTTVNFIRANVTAYTSGTVWAHLEALVPNATIVLPFTPSVTSGANITGWISTSGLQQISLQISAITTVVVTTQGTNDPTAATVQSVSNISDFGSNQSSVTTIGSTGTWSIVNPTHKWVRFQITTTGSVLTLQGVTARYGANNIINPAQSSIGLSGAGQVVVTALTQGTGAANLSKAEDAVAASGDAIVSAGMLRNDVLTSNASASGDYIVPTTDQYGAQYLKDEERVKRTYRCAFVVTPAATATDIFQIIGSATTTIEITKIIISGTQTTGGMIDFYIKKRSTANTGGTFTTGTSVPLNSTDAAATSVISIYTANPTTGTDVGNVYIQSVPVSALTATTSNIVEINFNERGKPLILNGVAQTIVGNANSATLAGGSLKITIEYREI